MKSYLSSLPLLLPIAVAWAEKQELIALREGKALTEIERADAVLAGVRHPEKIRIMRRDFLPEPENEDIMFIARQIGLFRSVGLTLGYAIHLQPGAENERYTLVHECVHVAQYEKKRGIGPFLTDYIRECLDPGFPFGMMEKEAIYVARDICQCSSDVNHLKTGRLANLNGVPA